MTPTAAITLTQTALVKATPIVTAVATPIAEASGHGWFYDASSQAIGAAVGALLAYVGGYYLLRIQLNHNEEAEKRKWNNDRTAHLKMFFEDTEKLRYRLRQGLIKAKRICDEKEFELVPNPYHNIEEIHKKYLEYRAFFNEEEREAVRVLKIISELGYMEIEEYCHIVDPGFGSRIQDRQEQEKFVGKYWTSIRKSVDLLTKRLDEFESYSPDLIELKASRTKEQETQL